jgi:hypothetical protein
MGIRLCCSVLFFFCYYAGFTYPGAQRSAPRLEKRHTYFISSVGNDNWEGTSKDKPWKTLKILQPGNTYLFRRNDTFSFVIRHVKNPALQKIVISSYGKGAKPLISAYIDIQRYDWQRVNANVWKAGLGKHGNIGFLNVNGSIKGVKVNDLYALKKPWDFFSDDQFLYVYTGESPAQFAGAVRAAPNGVIATLSDAMEISNIALAGTGGHGIQGTGSRYINIHDVDISDIGGSYLNGNIRYGNGIEFWDGAQHCRVTNCHIRNVYDVAVTLQNGKPKNDAPPSPKSYSDIIISDNLLEDNDQSFEFEVRDSISTFSNCVFEHNRCRNAGMGWSHAVRSDKNAGVHLLCYRLTKGIEAVVVRNNTFINALSGYVYFHENQRGNGMFTSYHNVVVLPASTPIKSQDTRFYTNNAAAFIREFGIEKRSIFKPLD